MDKLTLNLLGGIKASINDRSPIQFRTDKMRALLVYLALAGGRPHQRSSLAALLWPEMPQQTALKNLRQALHVLQQALDEQSPGLSSALFTITRQTVLCQTDLLAVDALALQSLLAACEAHRHRHLHLCHDCLARLETAVALYQGELLAGFDLPDAAPFEEWLLFWRERLQQQVVNALGQLAKAQAERGDVETALAHARQQAALDPFREEAHRLIMRLLARSRQHAQALAQHESCRRLLQEELGVEPAAETTALYHQIQAEQQGETAVANREQTAVLHHFPAQFTPFIGRQRELAQIEELFLDPDCRLVTLVGPGGMGKSRLALRAGEQLATRDGFADDVYFFPLAAVQTAESLLTNLLNGLGVATVGRITSQESLTNYLRDRRCLLVLDNFEQLIESDDSPEAGLSGKSPASSLLSELLAAAPGLRLLVTSQLPLNIVAERRLNLSGLDYPTGAEMTADPTHFSAVHLFVEAARQADTTFHFNTDNEAAVLQICRLVEGVPLALELAAAWVRFMDCEAIVAEIGRSLDFLSLSPQDKPERHQSMAAVFAYAWQLLPATEQTVLGQLTVFRGHFSLEAALEITEAALLTLARLLDRSFLQQRQGGETDAHYELHELLRQFVSQQTAAQNEAAARRHSDYYLNLVAAQEKAFYGPQPRQVVAAIQPYLSNIRQAWSWAVEHDHGTAVERGLEGLGRFYQTAALFPEGEAMFARAIDGSGQSSSLLVWHAFFLAKQGQYGVAIRQARQALARAGHNEAAHAEAATLLGKLLPHEGQFEEANSYQQQAIDYYRATAELEPLARSLRRMGIICWRAANYDQAMLCFQQAIPLHEALEHKAGLAQLYLSMGGVCWERGEQAQALAYAQQAQELYRAIEDRLGVATVATNLAILYEHFGEYEQALAANQQAIEIHLESGDRYGLALDLGGRGRCLLTMGEFDDSLSCYFRALEIERELGNEWGVAFHQAGIAAAYNGKGEWETAVTYYDLALPTLLAQGAPYYALGPLLGKAELLYQRGDWAAARELCEQAQTLATEAELPEFIQRSRTLAVALRAAAGKM